MEAGGVKLIVDGPGGPKTIGELLVDPFTDTDLGTGGNAYS